MLQFDWLISNTRIVLSVIDSHAAHSFLYLLSISIMNTTVTLNNGVKMPVFGLG